MKLQEKDVILDKNCSQIANQTKEIQNLLNQIDETATTQLKLQDLETRNNELISQNQCNEQTIATLRTELVNGTISTKKVKKELEKLGIENRELETLDLNVETVLTTIIKNPETFKTVREIMLSVNKNMAPTDACLLCHKKEIFTVEKKFELSTPSTLTSTVNIDLGSTHEDGLVLNPTINDQWKEECDLLKNENNKFRSNIESLQNENARQKVDLSTLSSQITSLNTQHIALQLANSQLASEKDVLVKNLENLKQEHSSLLHDQIALQCLHEQLSSEYEALSQHREVLKSSLRDIKIEHRDLREVQQEFTNQIEKLEHDTKVLREENENLVKLRAEHSKLKGDFRNLFTTSGRLKSEYKNIQQQYKNIRAENGRLQLLNTEMTGDLSSRTDQLKSLEIEFAKSTHRCDMLFQMNSNLDTDRRTLMDHVSQLLSQYHELLEHSLDDKQHYHDEEKVFTDKLNNLHRQKEKLEEKIMEHYKKLESCSPKK